MFIVATNIVASRPPERLLTRTPTNCSKIKSFPIFPLSTNPHKFIGHVFSINFYLKVVNLAIESEIFQSFTTKTTHCPMDC